MKQQAQIYLHFYVANLINCTNDGSPNHGWEYVCWKVGPCIATLNKLKDKKKYSTVKIYLRLFQLVAEGKNVSISITLLSLHCITVQKYT